MIVTVTSYKGGVGKTTTAVHLACYLQRQSQDVLLVDGDPNRACLAWSRRGELPFKVVDEKAATKYIAQYENIIIDTAARPHRDELEALMEGCDLLILPTTPEAMSLDALSLTVATLRELGTTHYQVLLTIVPPKPNRDGSDARAMLLELGYPLIKAEIKRLVAYTRASLQSVPVYDVERGVRAWKDYEAVGMEVFNRV